MSFIEEINSQAIASSRINTGNTYYKAIIGQYPFTANATIVQSSDYNCGALANELEFANASSQYLADAMKIGSAAGDQLDTLITTFIDLPRQGTAETDTDYATRFQAIVTQNTWPTRTGRYAIINALSYYFDPSLIEIIEWFDTSNLTFQVRLVTTTSTSQALFYDNFPYDSSYHYTGYGVPFTTEYISDIVTRIKAAGVDFTVTAVGRSSITTTTQSYVG